VSWSLSLTRMGRLLGRRSWRTTDQESTAFFEGLSASKKVAFEACVVWQHYFDPALPTRTEAVLYDLRMSRLITNANRKIDMVESQGFATLLRFGSLPAVFPPPPELRALRITVLERVFDRREPA
jgi:hypothetical protein